jgi:NAD(P)-dependent dehydrogenase (short-subunit alcohol dehydrogenase family)
MSTETESTVEAAADSKPVPRATIITGGGRGIGKAISLRIARETAVLLVGRTESDLAQTVAEIRSARGTADFITGDVADPATAEKAVAQVHKNGWTLHNLVCNAGIAKGGAATTFSKDTWREIFNVNVHGTFWFVQACLPAMVAQKGGNICIISSIAGIKGFKYDAAYTSSKHALVGMAKSLALEYAKHGITVVPICPSFVESEMTRRTIAGVVKHRGLTEAEAEKLVADKNPQRRIIPASEVADAVAVVLSGLVPSLNGHPMVLSGGE